MNKHYLFLLTCAMMILCACSSSQSEPPSTLDQLSCLLKQHPDSVYNCLQAYDHPEELPPDEYYQYVLLKIRATANCNLDISNDTAIYEANDYYIRIGDIENASWTSFYCGRLARKMKKYDQALFHLLEAEKYAFQCDNNWLMALIQFNLGAILAEQSYDSGTEKSLERFNKSTDYFILSGNAQNQKLQHENQRLQLHRLWMVLYLILSLCLAGGATALFYRKSRCNKKKILEAESTIHELQQMAKSYDEKENSFRSILLHHFNILKKAASLEMYINEESKKRDHHLLKIINEIVYGQETLNWDLLYDTMNQLYDGFFERLRNKYPQLDETEFRICCLSCTKFSSSEISVILKLSVNTIQMKRSAIRKKIGVGTFGNLPEFLSKE